MVNAGPKLGPNETGSRYIFWDETGRRTAKKPQKPSPFGQRWYWAGWRVAHFEFNPDPFRRCVSVSVPLAFGGREGHLGDDRRGADSDGSRPGFRDDLAHHSDLMSLGIPG